MSVQVNVPLDLIQSNAAVADAMSDLLAAIRSNGTRSARARRPGAPAKATGSSGAKRRARAKLPKAADTARRFVELLHKHGKLTTAAAKKALGLKDGKTIGGIVGSLNRWAGRKPGSPKIAMKNGKRGERIYSLTGA
jgi:hypothetical protein